MINRFLETSSPADRKRMSRCFNVPEDAVSFTFGELVGRSTPAAKASIEKLAAQVAHITGQAKPVILLQLDQRTYAKVQKAWQPLVTKAKHKHLTSGVGVSKAISSPSKENENENGNTREGSSYNSPPCVATQELNSGDRKVRRVPASLQSLSSTPCPSPPPSPSYLLSFAHPSPSLSHADGRGNRRAGL